MELLKGKKESHEDFKNFFWGTEKHKNMMVSYICTNKMHKLNMVMVFTIKKYFSTLIFLCDFRSNVSIQYVKMKTKITV